MPVRVVTEGGSPVRIVTSGGDPVRIVTTGISDPVRVIGGGLAPDAPIFVSGEVGTVDASTVVVTFSTDITAPCGDCALGFTVLVNGLADAITACVIVGGNTVQLTLTTAVAFGDTVTVSYDSTVGCIMESTGVTDLETFAAQAVTNNVVVWYRAGGAPVPIAAYRSKGAANLAASYVNLANPGTYDLTTGTAPAWDIVNGWKSIAASNQYLDTGITAITKGWVMLCRYSNFAVTNKALFGADMSGNNLHIYPYFGVSRYYRFFGDSGVIAGNNLSGVTGLSDGVGWINGLSDATFVSGAGSTTLSLYLLAGHTTGAPPGVYSPSTTYMQAFAIWNTNTDVAIWLPAVSAAMAAL